jgi:class 3 adenylate cyclase
MAEAAVRRWAFAGVLAAALGIAALDLARALDLRLLDLQFKALRGAFPRPASVDVVVVGIDEDTTRALPEPIALWHRHLARFLEAMGAARPTVLGVDVVLPARSFEGVLPGSDLLLTRALVQARRDYPLVVALTVSPAGTPRPVHPPFLGAVGGEGTGYAVFPVDDDGVIRRFDEGSLGAPLFAGQVARRLGIAPRAGTIDFSRGAAFDYVPFHRVLEWHAREEIMNLNREFTGKAVLLGAVLPYADDHAAPLQLAAWEGWPAGGARVPGVLLHAQALRNLMDGGLLAAAPRGLVVAAAGAAALLWFLSAGWASVLAVLAGIGLLLFAVSAWLVTRGWVLPVAPVLIAATLAAGTRLALDTLADLRERRRLRASFAGYVSPAVMEEILAGRIRPDDAGVRRFVCVMFSDIRGYTARGEQMRPEEVIAFLNRYFEHAVPLIHERGGTVVSIMGDGVMAVFGSPKPLDNPCLAAFDAARAMLAHAAGLQIDIGIGLNAGEALVGHVGASARHEYSAIGDVTNVASRLQGLTKDAGYRLLLSRAVAECLGPADALAPLGALQVRGHSPVEAFGYDRRT